MNVAQLSTYRGRPRKFSPGLAPQPGYRPSGPAVRCPKLVQSSHATARAAHPRDRDRTVEKTRSPRSAAAARRRAFRTPRPPHIRTGPTAAAARRAVRARSIRSISVPQWWRLAPGRADQSRIARTSSASVSAARVQGAPLCGRARAAGRGICRSRWSTGAQSCESWRPATRSMSLLAAGGAQSTERRRRLRVQDAAEFRRIEHVAAHPPGELLGTKNRHFW